MSAKKILTVTLTWPGDLPLSREALAEKLAETLYAPDVAMLAPVQAGQADYNVWEDGTGAFWSVEDEKCGHHWKYTGWTCVLPKDHDGAHSRKEEQ